MSRKCDADLIKHIKHERPCLSTFPNTEKRVENTTRSGVRGDFHSLIISCMQGFLFLFSSASDDLAASCSRQQGKHYST